ncbi:hypothetical protein GE061_004799 [Apolygus lucorum]|uniref:MADF domain-containing protein n=1 Tax=Apolygus lucorum TaxID=248454 RepID=A0A6A4J5U9_APOLU|nr:hypothetical protein GE061_004799 [Apolygus lucorum]
MSHVVKSIVLIDTSQLIHEVHSRPPLWNHRIVSGKETVERLWGEVAEALGTSGKDVKQKWKNLKDTFRKEMKKSIECGPSYTTMWPHYQRLTFLTEILLQSKRISYSSEEVLYPNVAHQQEARFDSEDSTENIVAAPEVRFSPKRRRETEEIVMELKPDPDAEDGVENCTGASSHVSGKPRVERASEVGFTERPSEMGFAPRMTSSQPMPAWDCYGMDEDYHFFMSLMPHMRGFEPLQKLKIRNRIQEIIIQEMTAESRTDGASSSTEPAK